VPKIAGVATLVSTLLSAVTAARGREHPSDCLICGRPVKPGDARMPIPGGGYVHRGCSTYRMRQAERIRGKLRA
jgi:hypothetical protein